MNLVDETGAIAREVDNFAHDLALWRAHAEECAARGQHAAEHAVELRRQGLLRGQRAGGIGGPIPTHWQVSGWPTIFLIDKKGVIRHMHVGNPGDAILDQEIDQLVQEPESQEVL